MTIEEQEIFNILNRVFERPKPFFISRDVDDILTIKDDFAIEFAEWIRKEVYYEHLTKEFIYKCNVYESEKELLEIFKNK
jgi:hypothetical protein